MSRAELIAQHEVVKSKIAILSAEIGNLPPDDDPTDLSTYFSPALQDEVNYAPNGSKYLAYLAPYGKGSLVHGTDYKDELYYTPAQFPNRSRLKGFWPTSTSGVKGYLQFATRGNYDGGVPKVATSPIRVGALNNFYIDIDWSFPGSLNANYLDEYYINSTSGNPNTKTAEIGQFLYAPQSTKDYLAIGEYYSGHPNIDYGTYTDPDGLTWRVRSLYNPTKPAARYITFIRSNGAPYFKGRMDKKHQLLWLIGVGAINATGYINGYATGIEIIGGSYDVYLNKWADTFN